MSPFVHRSSTPVPALLLLALLLLADTGPAQGICGDCNVSGALTVLDALEISKIAVGLTMASGAGVCTCDVDGDGRIGVVDALLVAQRVTSLPALLACGPACPVDYQVLRCGESDIDNAEIINHDLGAVANFAQPGTTVFYAIPLPPGGSGIELRLEGMAPATNLDLYLGRPGVIPGDLDSSNYTAVLGLSDSSPEILYLECADLERFGGFPIVAAVHAVAAGGTFDFSVICQPSICPQRHRDLPCGNALTGTFTGAQSCAGCPLPWPPDLAAGEDTVAFFAVPLVPMDVDRIEIRLDFASGDLDLLVADPGVAPADIDFGNYSRFSVILQPERIVIDDLSTPPISAYHGMPLALAVTAYAGAAPLDYELSVECSTAAGVTLIPCGFQQTDVVSVSVGTGAMPTDLTLPGANQFYGLTGIPVEATYVAIRVSGMGAGTDMDLLVGLPHTVPGDTDVGHYGYRSETLGNGDEEVILECSALYELGLETIAIVVHGKSPGEFDFRVDCHDFPCLCDGQVTSSWSGGCLDPAGGAAVEDRWSFFANSGETIEIRVDAYDDATTFDPAVALFAPGGGAPQLVASDGLVCRAAPVSGECPVLLGVATSSGSHQLSIKTEAAFGPAGYGNYVVSARVAGALVPLTPTADDVPVTW